MSEDLLFNDGDLDASLQHQRQQMAVAISKESEAYMLNIDEPAWANHLASEYAVDSPELQVEAMEVEDLGEAQVDVSHQQMQRAIIDPSTPTYIPGRRLRLRIPFTGDAGVFRLQPRTFTYNPARAEIGQLA
jgi:hypothetical protein